MLITLKILSKEFKVTNNDTKKAYLNVCKWIATKVIPVGDDNIQYNIKKVIDKQTGNCSFILDLYCSLEETKEKGKYCDICEERHTLFYLNSNYECNTCKMLPYRKRMDEKLKIIRSNVKNKMKGVFYE